MKRFATTVLVTLSLAGCAAPTINVVSAGMGAAQLGSSAYTEGELQSAVKRPRDRLAAATTRAFEALQYARSEAEAGADETVIVARDQQGRRARVVLSASTPVVTVIRIRVGFFGDQAISRLILEEITREANDENSPTRLDERK